MLTNDLRNARLNGQSNGASVASLTAPLVVKPAHAEFAIRPAQPAAVGAFSPEGAHPSQSTEMDADLARSVRRSGRTRRGFYCVVLVSALAGQATGLGEVINVPLILGLPAVAAVELGGIVTLNNADVRRRLGEHATGSRILSASIAFGATAFNWLAHHNHLVGGFFAGMSALGYLVWLTHTENQRRDRLRAKGDLPPTTPAYEMWGHWLRHPFITARAKSLAKQHPNLGLYPSLKAAREEVREERQTAAISKVLHRKIRAAVDPTTADIAVAVYEVSRIASRLAAGADYDGLTELVAADLAPERLAPRLGVRPDGGLDAAADLGKHAISDAPAEAPLGTIQTHPNAPENAPRDASERAQVGASETAIEAPPPDAVGAPDRTHPKRVVGRTPGASLDARTRRALVALARKHDGRPSERAVMDALKIGRPKAKEYMAALGLPADNINRIN